MASAEARKKSLFQDGPDDPTAAIRELPCQVSDSLKEIEYVGLQKPTFRGLCYWPLADQSSATRRPLTAIVSAGTIMTGSVN